MRGDLAGSLKGSCLVSRWEVDRFLGDLMSFFKTAGNLTSFKRSQDCGGGAEKMGTGGGWRRSGPHRMARSLGEDEHSKPHFHFQVIFCIDLVEEPCWEPCSVCLTPLYLK